MSPIAQANSGNTKTDAAIDIDGGIGTLKYFARLGEGLGAKRALRDGKFERLAREEAFQAMHLSVPIRGVGIHINAFNFPSWGLWEKAAVALLSGVPVFAKPATATALLSYQMVKDVIDAGVLPAGALSLVVGGARELTDFVTGQDAIAFTGSADTAAGLRKHPNVVGYIGAHQHRGRQPEHQRAGPRRQAGHARNSICSCARWRAK